MWLFVLLDDIRRYPPPPLPLLPFVPRSTDIRLLVSKEEELCIEEYPFLLFGYLSLGWMRRLLLLLLFRIKVPLLLFGSYGVCDFLWDDLVSLPAPPLPPSSLEEFGIRVVAGACGWYLGPTE